MITALNLVRMDDLLQAAQLLLTLKKARRPRPACRCQAYLFPHRRRSGKCGAAEGESLKKQQLAFPWAPTSHETGAEAEQATGPEKLCVGCGKPGQPAPLHHLLHALRPKLAAEAQKHYDDWAQDEDGCDEEYGEGGICDQISNGLSSVLHQHLGNINTTDGGADGDDHAFPVVYDRDHAFAVDIPPHVYESGGGYKWRKIPDVEIRPEDVQIEPLDRSWFNGQIEEDGDEPARGHVCASCAPRARQR